MLTRKLTLLINTSTLTYTVACTSCLAYVLEHKGHHHFNASCDIVTSLHFQARRTLLSPMGASIATLSHLFPLDEGLLPRRLLMQQLAQLKQAAVARDNTQVHSHAIDRHMHMYIHLALSSPLPLSDHELFGCLSLKTVCPW